MKFKNIIVAISTSLFLILLASLFYYGYLPLDENTVYSSDGNLNPQEIYNQVINIRQKGIDLAKANGDYQCCIDPDCTMCYDSPNVWNYHQAGKCFCDEFIAEGKDPCPQCRKALNCTEQGKHGSEADGYCDINLNKSSI